MESYVDSNAIPTTHTQIVDTTTIFNTNQIFRNRDELLEWAREIGRQNCIVVVIGRSDFNTGGKGRKDKIVLRCEKSGKYRPRKGSVARNPSASAKCECPFKLKGIPLASEGWTLRVICGFHNHELAKTLVGHSFSSRLMKEHKKIVHDLTMKHVNPKQILSTLKDHSEYAACHSTIEQIYNERSSFKKSLRGPSTELQHLVPMLERDNFVCQYIKLPGTDIVSDIFWAHPNSITLLNTFPVVLMIGDTFKTNKHSLPLMEIVGVTSTNQTYVVGFAFLSSKHEGNFVWALERLRDCFWRPDLYPNVILTNRELPLIRAVALVFPTSANMLCRWHIEKCVYAKIKLNFPDLKDTWNEMKSAWNEIINADTESVFLDSVESFGRLCVSCPNLFKYVKETWITDHKEKFVSLWVDRHMHLGNYTTNRVEGAHSKLKRMLMDCRDDLVTVWDSMKANLVLEHNNIIASFERHKNRLQHQHWNNYMLKHLLGYVSKNALDLILEQLNRANTIGIDSSMCGCVIRATHGLPCACELVRYITMHIPIPLETIHTHWKRLYLGVEQELQAQQGLETITVEAFSKELDLISRRFHNADIAGRQALWTSIREISRPNTGPSIPSSSLPSPPREQTSHSTRKRRRSQVRAGTAQQDHQEDADHHHQDDADLPSTNSDGSFDSMFDDYGEKTVPQPQEAIQEQPPQLQEAPQEQPHLGGFTNLSLFGDPHAPPPPPQGQVAPPPSHSHAPHLAPCETCESVAGILQSIMQLGLNEQLNRALELIDGAGRGMGRGRV